LNTLPKAPPYTLIGLRVSRDILARFNKAAKNRANPGIASAGKPPGPVAMATP